MKDEAPISGDRETVELLSAQPELLAIADAVRATQQGETRRWTLRPRLLVGALTVAALSAACAVAFAGPFGRPGTPAAVSYPPLDLLHLTDAFGGHRVPVKPSCPIHRCSRDYGYPMPDLLDTTITRTDGAVSSIGVTIRGTVVDSTARLQVHMEGAEPSGSRRVVFSTQVSLAPTLSPPSGSGTLSEWSGTLSPNDWDGGCQDARYWLTVREPNAGGGVTLIQPPAFNCRRATEGPTGSAAPTGR